MEQYLEATTVHGFSYLGRNHPLLVRVFWTGIIIAGFAIAGVLIGQSIITWDKDQTITTLESIATPIQETLFPTVTVCPHEDNPSDNWSFLEKFLNSVDLSGNNGMSKKVRSEIVDEIATKLLDVIEKKYRSNKNLSIWESNKSDDTFFNYGYGTALIDTANLKCKKKFSIKDLRKSIVEHFMTGMHFIDVLRILFDGEVPWIDPGYFDGVVFGCETDCCENLIKEDFFQGIINAGYFMYSQSTIGLGTFLTNFANLTNSRLSIIDKYWSTFDLDVLLELGSTFDPKYDCDLSDMDKFLHSYFKDLSKAIGFTGNNSLSLFDIPSMLSLVKSEAEGGLGLLLSTKEAFLFSQCEKKTLLNSNFKECFTELWRPYYDHNGNGKLVNQNIVSRISPTNF